MQTKDPYLKHCEKDPIHIIGQIQSFGLLLAVEQETLRIVQASSNAPLLLGATAEELLGEPIGACNITGLPELLQQSSADAGASSLHGPLWVKDQPHHLVVHAWQELWILEFEPIAEQDPARGTPPAISTAITPLLQSENYEHLLEEAARQLQQVAGYDRTMIYRFHADYHGEVVAEAHNGKTGPSYLGLHYPATDIPQPARDLFTINPIRVIADVWSEPVALHPTSPTTKDAPTDLTRSVLRSASPVHIQYLKNMGVAASMTISLMLDGKLWGLIACHHSSPRLVDYRTRQTCQQIGQLFCSRLQLHLTQSKNARMNRTTAIGSQLARYILSGSELAANLTSQSHTIADLIECGGAAVCLEGHCELLGKTPGREALSQLLSWLRQHQQEDLFITDELGVHYPGAAAIKDTAAGLLSAAITPEEGEFILWFKPEAVSTVYWGGDPEHPADIQHTPLGTQVSPRRSFEKWAKLMRGRSTPWRDPDTGSVHRLRDDILHVVAKKSHEIRRLHEELEEAYRQLDTFSYTVSHDLRTPLNAVRVYSEILLDELESGGPAPLTSAAHKITRNADRMSNLINAVLDYSRARKAETKLSQVDIASMVEPILDDLRTAYRDHPIEFHLGSLPPVYGDATMVGQVFSNLLSNAVKYSCNRETSVVTMRGELTNEGVVYSVQDNGIGIAMDKADQVFQLFSRLSTAGDFEGHGVGMTIVKKIMERHNGKIWFDSVPGAGSTFYALFPHARH